jgi:hypothetical protein
VGNGLRSQALNANIRAAKKSRCPKLRWTCAPNSILQAVGRRSIVKFAFVCGHVFAGGLIVRLDRAVVQFATGRTRRGELGGTVAAATGRAVLLAASALPALSE